MAKRDAPSENTRPNTLGLRDRDLGDLLNTIDRAKGRSRANRAFTRWKYQQTAVPVLIQHPGGTEMQVRMACRNLSKGGIGLLHRSYLHIHTRCVVTLEHPTRGPQQIEGKVIRCLHLDGMIHEIGIAFDEEIDLRAFARPDPMQELFAIESVNPQTLVGTLLLVEDSQMDARLVKHFLRETQLRIRHTESVAEAEKIAKQGVGLVLCDIHLGEENGGDLVRRLNETSAALPPVVMMSADTSRATHELVSDPVVAGFLAKPFSQEALLRTVAEFLSEFDELDPGGPAAGDIRADRQIIAAMLPELAAAADKVEKAVKSADRTIVLSMLMQIKGIAPVLGLADLGMLAETLVHQVVSSSTLEGLESKLAEMVRMCREATQAG